MSHDSGDSFLQALRQQIESHRMLAPGDRCVLAVSGGYDSMAMMHGMAQLRLSKTIDLECLHVAHLNHKLRDEESDGDEEFVRRQAEELHLPITCSAIEIGQLAGDMGESIETVARQKRYEFLAQVAQEQSCSKIALAHNADDNVETILHRILRGTGIDGLAGIPVVRKLSLMGGAEITLVRPMLSLTRREIEQFLANRNISYRQDSSNLSLQYTRNRIRHGLLPLLRQQYNPNINNALLQLGDIAGDMAELLDAEVNETLKSLIVRESAGVLELELCSLAQKHRIQQAQIMRCSLEYLNVGQRDIGYHHISQMLNLINATSDSKTVELPNSVTLRSNGKTLLIETNRQNTSVVNLEEIIALQVPGNTKIESDFIVPELCSGKFMRLHSVDTEYIHGSMEELSDFLRDKKHNEEMLDCDCLEGDLILRRYNQGDMFVPLGSEGGKKLGDFFTDRKIPVEQRQRIGLLCDQRGIVWVMGMRSAHRVRVTRTTSKILRIKANVI
jgi:tRNA(Ile)-lysidine synthase